MPDYSSGPQEEKKNEEVQENAETEVDIRNQKVVTQETVAKKPPLGQRFKHMFLKTSFADVRGYVLHQVIIPGAADLFKRTLHTAVDTAFSGKNQQPPSPNPQGHITYNTSPVRQPMQSVMMPRQPAMYTGAHLANTVVIATYEDAEAVLSTMYETLSKYNFVTLATFYNMTGQPVNPIDNKWGWSSLPGAAIRQINGGFLLDLPALEPAP